MTNREKLEEIRNDYNWETRSCDDDMYFQDYFKQIDKDLEVLEILKELPFEIYLNGGGDDWEWFIDLKQSFIISEEQASKIKEWLDK